MEKVVSIRNLFFGYDHRLILEDINLDIYRGDYMGIVGPNGSAKSTLIKLMLGLLKPQKGRIKILGQDIEKFKEWGKIGYVAQKATSFNTSFPATVEEVVTANLFPQVGLFKSIKRKHREKVYEILRLVGIERFKDSLVGSLSGGQQQRVFIARTLVSQPEIIFLDEPTTGIDVKSQVEFYDLMEKLNKEMKITIVMVSHDIGVITEKVNRVVCMGNKKLITHNRCCNIPFNEVLARFYGEKMSLLIHDHEES